MAQILSGKDVAAALNARMADDVEALKAKGVTPCLATFRVGERPDTISYERGATKRCADVGVEVKNVVLDENITQETLIEEIKKLNNDASVHGVLMLNPFPDHLEWEEARMTLDPKKDIDGITDGSNAMVFTGRGEGYAPCTPQACMEILDYYNIDTKGKKAVVVGRSLIVGKPAAMMLLAKNATVTICHTKTIDMPSVVREADIVIVAVGRAKNLTADFFSADQVVIDVGINMDEESGKLCGDVDYDNVEPIVGAITPVPGGVGSVTTSVLVSHAVEAAKLTVQ